MPFTLSHAAAALPFRKLKPIWPALVIGTFAPDFQYFITISDEDRSGHHFPDVLLITLPVALLVLWVFEWIVKGPMIELLPSGLQRRLHAKAKPLSFWGWKRFGSIVLWIAVGIATHVLWDSFTHFNTLITAHWRMFSHPVPLPFHRPVMLVKLLQHMSTLLGLLALAAWLAAWYRRTAPGPNGALREFSPFVKATVLLTMITIALAAGYPYALYTLASFEVTITTLSLVVTTFEASTLIFCVQVLIYGLVLTIGARVRRLPAAQLDEPMS